MTFGSLFSGIGGMDLGLERAGMECRWQVEIDPFCSKVLEKHWPKVPKYGDIKEISGEQLERVDLIAGGFPCQDVSSASGRCGIESHTRSGLWFEMRRIICLVQPRFVLVENVSALLDRLDGGSKPAPIQRVLGDLAEVGFDAEWDCLPTGLTSGHRRDRVFIVAYPVCAGLPGDGECGAQRTRRNVSGWTQPLPVFLGQVLHPSSLRNLHGIPRRLDRIKSLGNSVHPAASQWIGERIIEATERN